ncbi:hypothetical protein [Desulfobulbus alkaliphilus]|uniref:hypothetical protein n=1 Tax=Desulfobulbus alkaliphilus TaxID=869814 RepID=UPI001966CCE2|nr:hypothetical protein [Desulfobulbus alkaliphilus]MBM9537111.1 hypothetical protein [Desulfobulbus alkaliphilus]
MKVITFMISLAFVGLLVLGGTSAMVPEALDGEQIVKQRCTQCHSFGRIERAMAVKDQAAWEITVNRMMGKRSGLLNTDERAAVLEYLVKK